MCDKNFEAIFDKLCYTHETSTVWTDFLNYCIDQFLINPDKKYFDTERYTVKEQEYFNQLFGAWILRMDEKLEDHEYYDFLGEFYENIIISRYKAGNKGQFFTPMDVASCMAELTYTNNDKKDDKEGHVCYDCTCGSGRTLLAWHNLRPQDRCIGWDLDEQAAKMCVLNFIVHGIRGSVVWCNSLSYEFFDAWKVHEFPFTVMSVDSFGESECFIGVDLDSGRSESVDLTSDECRVDRQTTLI